MKTGYNYDAINNTVTISASFAKKASQVGSAEYDIMLKLRKDYPNLKVVKEEKTAKKQLTYKEMAEFISLHHNGDELKKAFEAAKTLSKFHSMPFSFVKAWFEKTFPYFKDGNYTLDNDGKIKVLPLEKKDDPAAAAGEPVQSLEVLKNQDAEATDADPSVGNNDSPLAEAV